MDIKTIIFWIAVVIVAWLGLRHLITIIIGVSSTGPLKSGQRLCHATSLLLLCGGCIAAIYYRIWWPLAVGLIVELLFRKSVIRSGIPSDKIKAAPAADAKVTRKHRGNLTKEK